MLHLLTGFLRALRKDKAQEVDAAVTFTADVEVGNLDIPSNRAGDVDLYRLFNGTLLKSGDQVKQSFSLVRAVH